MRRGALISKIETRSSIYGWRVYWGIRRYPKGKNNWYRAENELEAIAQAWAEREEGGIIPPEGGAK